MTDTSIEWCDAVWNPVTGCDKVSPGCAHCYAEGVAERFWPKQYPIAVDREGIAIQPLRSRQFSDVYCHMDRLDQPLRWKTPRKVFVNSMSDLFHEAVPDAFIDRVFSVMALAPQHTFQILTKRAERMRDYMVTLSEPSRGFETQGMIPRLELVAMPAVRGVPGCDSLPAWPLRNVWLGVSVENQRLADERIPLLLKTPAAVRFISAEPLLGPVLLDNGTHSWLTCRSLKTEASDDDSEYCCDRFDDQGEHYHGLDWVIVGGESGRAARSLDLAWARSIVQQCQSAGVPVFMKQLGASTHVVCPDCEGSGHGGHYNDPGFCNRCLGCHKQSIVLSDSKGGNPDEWPEDLRIRQFPSGARL